MVFTTKNDVEENFQILGRCVPPFQLDAISASTKLEQLCNLNPKSKASIFRLSGIACVIGVSTSEPKIIEEMIANGMNIAVLNLASGKEVFHYELLQNIRTAVDVYSKKIGMTCPLAIGVVTRGYILTTGFPFGTEAFELTLVEGDIVKLTSDADYMIKNNPPYTIHVNYDKVHQVVKVGNKVVIGRKYILLVCTGIEDNILVCKVLHGGIVRSRFRVRFPGVQVELPLCENDKSAIHFAAENELDIIFASHIRTKACVGEMRQFLGPEGEHIKIVSQISNRQGISNCDEIIEASDGIMIDRRGLCFGMDQKKIFLAQKSISSKCNLRGKPVVCTVRMDESTLTKSNSFDPEYMDIANCILDGVDCIFVHEETSKGNYPVESIQRMGNICKQAEVAVWQKRLVHDLSHTIIPPAINIQAITCAAAQISLQIVASAIIVTSTSMKSAQLIVQFRPKCPVIAVTRKARNARQAHLYRGILPLIYRKSRADDWNRDIENRVYYGINFGIKSDLIKAGDPVVIVKCSQQGYGYTDEMQILYTTRVITREGQCTC